MLDGFSVAMEVPMFKGKGKDPLSVNSYRKISLRNVIGKVFEQLLLVVLSQITPLGSSREVEGQAPPALGTSFILQKAVSYMVEKGQYLLVSQLDARSTFYVVWHDGLFLKMYEMSIKAKAWGILKHWYKKVLVVHVFLGINLLLTCSSRELGRGILSIVSRNCIPYLFLT